MWLSGLSASLQTKGSPVRFPVRAFQNSLLALSFLLPVYGNSMGLSSMLASATYWVALHCFLVSFVCKRLEGWDGSLHLLSPLLSAVPGRYTTEKKGNIPHR